MIMKIISLVSVSIALILFGCIINNKSFYGTYSFDGCYDVKHQLILSQDSTFFYINQSGLRTTTSRGKYFQSRNIIYLHTKTDSFNNKLKVTEYVLDSSKKVLFKVVDNEDNPLSKVAIRVNEDTILVTDSAGNVSIDWRQNVNFISIKYLDLNWTKFLPKNQKSNLFNIIINNDVQAYINLDSVRLKIKNNKLVMIGNPISNGNKIILKKTNNIP